MPKPRRKYRSQADRDAAWLAWRKKGLESFGPEYCGCRISLSPAVVYGKQKCCEVCPGCNLPVKKAAVKLHRESCRGYRDIEAFAKSIQPGDEVLTPPKYAEMVASGVAVHYVRCHRCGQYVKDRFEEWHWMNNCKGRQHETERPEDRGDESSRTT